MSGKLNIEAGVSEEGAPATGVSGKVAGVEIVAAHPAHCDALRDVHVKTWAVTFRDRVPDEFYRERLAMHRVRDWAEVVRRQTAVGGGVVAATDNGHIAGFCQYGSTEDEDDDPGEVGHIHRLYVDPLHQRKGIGRTLLSAATTRLRQRGMSAATLWVLETDERAQAFYRRLGWKPDGERKSGSTPDLRYRSLLV